MIPNIEQYRTTNVLLLCKNIRTEQNYHATPILADALQDADFADEAVLTVLRSEHTYLVVLWRLVALIYSDESAKAVQWIDNLARKMTKAGSDYRYAENGAITYDGLMKAAATCIENGDWISGPGFSWENVFGDNIEEFWKNYELVSGTKVEDHSGDFVSCSC